MKLFEEILNMSEIEEFHEKRMKTHIERVKKFLLLFAESDLAKELDFTKKDALELAANHDKDKLSGKLYDQYKYISWLYHCKIENIPCDIEYTREMDMATTEHIRTNKHHPEYWEEGFEPSIVTDFNQRDSTKLKPRDGRKMPDKHIIEMCCDWKSTSMERGNTATSWADKCKRDNRYIFTNDQWDLIYDILKIID